MRALIPGLEVKNRGPGGQGSRPGVAGVSGGPGGPDGRWGVDASPDIPDGGWGVDASPDIPDGLLPLDATSDGRFVSGKEGVTGIFATGDRKVELVAFGEHTLACVVSALGPSACYPLIPPAPVGPVRAVMMDLDGTTIRSEDFWIEIIRQTTASLLKDETFHLSESDLPFVSGHSVSEHLDYCIGKYCPDRTLAEGRDLYFSHTKREMARILRETSSAGANASEDPSGLGSRPGFQPSEDSSGLGPRLGFQPNEGVKEFLLALKARKIRIGLVTSGLHEKAWPEILSAFRTLELGDPADFYDAIITAGFPLGRGAPGTLGELEAKPHPWLYAEMARVGLGIPWADRGSVVGIEDSGAGVCAVRLAGYTTIGLGGGNILQSGCICLCDAYLESFSEILKWIDERA